MCRPSRPAHWLHTVCFDILPGLKTGDSYCAQGRRNAASESLRWVPAAGGMTASLTSQANRACPALNTLIAPTASRSFSSARLRTPLQHPCKARTESSPIYYILCGWWGKGSFSQSRKDPSFCYSTRLTPLGHNALRREYHAWLSTITDTET